MLVVLIIDNIDVNVVYSIYVLMRCSVWTIAAAAAIFFVMYEVNMVALAWVLPQEESDRRSPVFWTQLLRKLCSIANGLGILAFAFMSTDRDRYRLYIAVVEW